MRFLKVMMALFMGVLCVPSIHAQTTATNTTKATAQLVASCKLTTQNVSFGALMLPLTTQSANSTLQVLCSKEAPYSITMGTLSNVWLLNAIGTNSYSYYNTTTNKVTNITADTTGPCGTMSGSACVSNLGYVNSGVAQYTSYCSWGAGCTIYKLGANYGTMVGSAKGDSVVYSIQHPTNPGSVWSATNAYSASGTGTTQNVPVVATLIPSQSSSFPTPDMYTDTVTTQINF